MERPTHKALGRLCFTNMALGPKKSDSTYVFHNEIVCVYVFCPFPTHFIPAQ